MKLNPSEFERLAREHHRTMNEALDDAILRRAIKQERALMDKALEPHYRAVGALVPTMTARELQKTQEWAALLTAFNALATQANARLLRLAENLARQAGKAGYDLTERFIKDSEDAAQQAKKAQS